jgi:putative RNA 2'-phosphotransferase
MGRRPYEFGLVLDENGFVSVQMLLKAICEEKDWKFIRDAHFHELLLREPESPIELEGSRIRSVDRSHLPIPEISRDPPKLLYVSIRQKAHAHVLEKGISPSACSQVILSSDRDMALRMGRRYDSKAVLLTVLCDKCMEQGVHFYQAGGSLFTAMYIPPKCFTGPSLFLKRAPKEQAGPSPQHPITPGSFTLEFQNEKPVFQKVKSRKKEIVWKKNRKRLQRNPEYL